MILDLNLVKNFLLFAVQVSSLVIGLAERTASCPRWNMDMMFVKTSQRNLNVCDCKDGQDNDKNARQHLETSCGVAEKKIMSP